MKGESDRGEREEGMVWSEAGLSFVEGGWSSVVGVAGWALSSVGGWSSFMMGVAVCGWGMVVCGGGMVVCGGGWLFMLGIGRSWWGMVVHVGDWSFVLGDGRVSDMALCHVHSFAGADDMVPLCFAMLIVGSGQVFCMVLSMHQILSDSLLHVMFALEGTSAFVHNYVPYMHISHPQTLLMSWMKPQLIPPTIGSTIGIMSFSLPPLALLSLWPVVVVINIICQAGYFSHLCSNSQDV